MRAIEDIKEDLENQTLIISQKEFIDSIDFAQAEKLLRLLDLIIEIQESYEFLLNRMIKREELNKTNIEFLQSQALTGLQIDWDKVDVDDDKLKELLNIDFKSLKKLENTLPSKQSESVAEWMLDTSKRKLRMNNNLEFLNGYVKNGLLIDKD